VVYNNGDVIFLHDDQMAQAMPSGKLSITRASRVRFDEESQKWKVWRCLPGELSEQMGGTFDSYKDAVAFEVSVFNQEIQEPGVPEEIQKLFACPDGGA